VGKEKIAGALLSDKRRIKKILCPVLKSVVPENLTLKTKH